MRVEVLYIDGCSSRDRLMPRLRELLDEQGVDAPVELVDVESPDAAEEQRFLGSPTVRIDGVDVEPAVAERGDHGLTCRLYHHPDGTWHGVPADEWITEAITRSSG